MREILQLEMVESKVTFKLRFIYDKNLTIQSLSTFSLNKAFS